MELRHLRYFVAVAEARSFSRAAARLDIAQPPLSQQIRRLEEELGVRLFDRTSQQVALTRAGEEFLVHARNVLGAAAAAVRAAALAERGEAGRLSVAFINSAAYSVLPDLVRSFRFRHPNIRLELHEMVIAEQLDALLEARIDVGLLRPPVSDEALATVAVASEAFVVALPGDHPLASRACLTLRDLVGESLIAYPAGHRAGFRERMEDAFAREGAVATVVQEATQAHTLCGLAAGGVGVAIVPQSARVLAMEGLTFVSLAAQLPPAEVWLCWRREARDRQIIAMVDVAGEMAAARAAASTG